MKREVEMKLAAKRGVVPAHNMIRIIPWRVVTQA
jgi:hypothetical protein